MRTLGIIGLVLVVWLVLGTLVALVFGAMVKNRDRYR